MTPFLIDIVTHTPVGVWIGLGVLVALGLQQTRDRDVSVARLLLVPFAMAAFSLLGTWNAFADAGAWRVAGGWGVGAAAGFAANRALDLPRRVHANADGTLRIGGSFAPLALFMTIFGMRYAIGVTLAVEPRLAHDPAVALLAAVATGLPTGLLFARSRKALASRQTGDTLASA